MKQKKLKLGFTLTELAIAIAFVSILLLTIAVVTLNMIHSYHKGMAMKSINSVGLALINEFSSAFSESPVFNPEALCHSLGDIYADGSEGKKCMDDGAMKYIYQEFKEEITITKNSGVEEPKILPTAGVFCTGKYSYVWNTGYVLAQEGTDHSMASYFYSGGSRLDEGFRLRKYLDVGRKLCSNNFPKDGDNNTLYPDASDGNHKPVKDNIWRYNAPGSSTGSIVEEPLKSNILSSELINTSDVALYSLTIHQLVINKQSGRALFSGSFVLGSITGDIDLNYDDSGEEGEYSSCKLEGTSTFDVEYCATNKFNFAIRAMGGNSGS